MVCHHATRAGPLVLVKVHMLLLPLLAVEAMVALELEPGWSNETTGAVDEGYHGHMMP